jgi:hypothetical protein
VLSLPGRHVCAQTAKPPWSIGSSIVHELIELTIEPDHAPAWGAADDPEAAGRVAAFAQGLGELGWTIGRNMRMEVRFAGGSVAKANELAAELVGLSADGAHRQ